MISPLSATSPASCCALLRDETAQNLATLARVSTAALFTLLRPFLPAFWGEHFVGKRTRPKGQKGEKIGTHRKKIEWQKFAKFEKTFAVCTVQKKSSERSLSPILCCQRSDNGLTQEGNAFILCQ